MGYIKVVGARREIDAMHLKDLFFLNELKKHERDNYFQKIVKNTGQRVRFAAS